MNIADELGAIIGNTGVWLFVVTEARIGVGHSDSGCSDDGPD